MVVIMLVMLAARNAVACCDPTYDIGCVCDQFGCEIAASPLAVKLSAGPWRLTGFEDPVEFDLRATGRREIVGWTARDSGIAFLSLDRNGNGRIDDGSELFGDATPLADGSRAANGFAALVRYDMNLDAVIDRRDTIWTALLFWIDSNHDGLSQPDELTSVAESPVTMFELVHHWTGRRDTSGNFFRYQAQAHIGGSVRSYYDIYFGLRQQPAAP
ncbi:MAG TPA: hypothetical protein VF618_02310 [Thermoanaerobaculia bacterium]